MASKSLQELQDKLQSIQYTPKTDEQLRLAAQQQIVFLRYHGMYNSVATLPPALAGGFFVG